MTHTHTHTFQRRPPFDLVDIDTQKMEDVLQIPRVTDLHETAGLWAGDRWAPSLWRRGGVGGEGRAGRGCWAGRVGGAGVGWAGGAAAECGERGAGAASYFTTQRLCLRRRKFSAPTEFSYLRIAGCSVNYQKYN